MTLHPIIRNATQSDMSELLALVMELAVFEKEPEAVTNTVKRMIEDGFGPKKVYDAFVAEVDGKIIGTAIVYYRYSTWKGRCLYLEDLIVTETHRGKGVGQRLFDYCIAFGKSNNCKRMTWQVLDWNELAIGFYKKNNAELDGEWINGSLEL